MGKILIGSERVKNSKTKRKFDHNQFLRISEMFSHACQGEGRWSGHPALFLRLSGCTLSCKWCDSREQWKYSQNYSFEEICNTLEQHDCINWLYDNDVHIVLTGGQPLLYQNEIVGFFEYFKNRFSRSFLPFIEVENECTIMIQKNFDEIVSHYNNSPKLSNSGVSKNKRYKPEVIKQQSDSSQSDFKFVISNEKDWEEIEKDFLEPLLVDKKQIILMPCGASQEELSRNSKFVVELAAEKGVRYSDRLHIRIYDRLVGV